MPIIMHPIQKKRGLEIRPPTKDRITAIAAKHIATKYPTPALVIPGYFKSI